MTRTAGEGKVMATTRAEAIGEAIRWRIPKVDSSITAVSPFWEAARSCERETKKKRKTKFWVGLRTSEEIGHEKRFVWFERRRSQPEAVLQNSQLRRTPSSPPVKRETSSFLTARAFWREWREIHFLLGEDAWRSRSG